MTKTLDETLVLIEELASQNYIGDEITMPRDKSVFEVDNVNLLRAKIDVLTNSLSKLNVSNDNTNVENVQAVNNGCEFCGGPHAYGECPSSNREDANFVQANQQRSL